MAAVLVRVFNQIRSATFRDALKYLVVVCSVGFAGLSSIFVLIKDINNYITV